MLAWRNLWRNHRRTLIMLAAITVGVWAMIFMTALMRGMVDDMLHNGIRGLPGEVQVHDPAYRDDPSINNSMRLPEGELLRVLQGPEIRAWTARIKVPAVISSERDSRGINLLGVEPDGELQLGFELEDLVQGRFIDAGDDPGIVIGARLAERLETYLQTSTPSSSQTRFRLVQ